MAGMLHQSVWHVEKIKAVSKKLKLRLSWLHESKDGF